MTKSIIAITLQRSQHSVTFRIVEKALRARSEPPLNFVERYGGSLLGSLIKQRHQLGVSTRLGYFLGKRVLGGINGLIFLGGIRLVRRRFVHSSFGFNSSFGLRHSLFQTNGHLNVDVRSILRPVSCDLRAATMISTTCKACSGVKSHSLPVANVSAASDAPCCHT